MAQYAILLATGMAANGISRFLKFFLYKVGDEIKYWATLVTIN